AYRRRYWGFLLGFVAAMQLLIFAGDVWTFFVAWEWLGLSSFALIGYENRIQTATRGAQKAFFITRLGDAAMWAGLLTLWAACGASDFPTLFNDIHELTLREVEIQILGEAERGAPTWLNLALLSVFVGASAKAAQAPFSVWLADAMVGPTPVSALLHSSTMVAAGVWALIRLFPVMTPEILTLTAYVGSATALLAAVAALAQRHLKKILAYSTVSQLGLMFLAVGAQFPEIAGFHLATHAFYKCALFLCAARISHELEHIRPNGAVPVYDIYAMGGLRKRLPTTFVVFVLAAAALVGIPGTAGYVSKDGIFVSAVGWALVNGVFTDNYGLLTPAVLALICVGLTAFYTVRMTLLVFGGRLRVGSTERPPTRAPLMSASLAILTPFFLWPIFGPAAFHDAHRSFLVERLHFAAPASLVRATTELALWAGERYHVWIAVASGLTAVIGAAVAVPIYLPLSRRLSRMLPPRRPPAIKRWAAQAFGLDTLWERILRPALKSAANTAAAVENSLVRAMQTLIVAPVFFAAAASAKIERGCVWLVSALARSVVAIGGVARRLQSPKLSVRFFVALLLFASALVAAYLLNH
ncbi:MAG: NADH-quinone oxidoreductase subunit L, partial [Bacteroidia bacterium]|nr:NADH-quinone oxidoreductase subunit L [Bacteroidia bacterium]MDW8333187.1 NADH-quinone oxidoreductase subunit L [Bacteroidia bacterium]